MIFETERLSTRLLKHEDSNPYFDMMGNANVMTPIPRPTLSRTESDEHLNGLLKLIGKNSEKLIWAIEEKKTKDFIGLCALLKNDEGDNEIGYRLREKYWNIGYGTEITKGLISHSFEKLGFDKITADVNIDNIKSIKILEKFMVPVKEFYNKNDECMDRRYELKAESLYHFL